jgi:hypothetical protein
VEIHRVAKNGIFCLFKGGTMMGFRDWLKGPLKKGSGHISDADVQAIARRALDLAAHEAGEAAKAALDAGRGDDDIVRAAVKAAAMEIGAAYPGMQDAEVLSLLGSTHPNTRQAVLAAARAGLSPVNSGAGLPSHRAGSLSAAFDRYVAHSTKRG